MSSKSWIIWTAMLTLPGLAGLWMAHVQNARQAALIAECRQRVSEGTEEYLDSYRQWSRLSAEEKAENSWGQGKYGGLEIQKSISADQDERLRGYIAELAGGQTAPQALSDILYGSGWQQKVEQYRRENERREMIAWASSVAVGVGILAGISGIAAWAAKKIFVRAGKNKSGKEQQQNDTESHSGETDCQGGDKSAPAVLHKALFEQVCREPQEGGDCESACGGYFEAYGKKRAARPQRNVSGAGDAAAVSGKNAALAVEEREEPPMPEAAVWGGIEETSAGAMMTNEPVLSSLSELTEEVSAIRQFAAQQQNQMRKLQDGYDWMLIRRFCLRIIRCVDNLCDRIERLAEQGQEISLLQDVADELVFALESSGVEQYEPDVGVSYKGLEKYAEAVGERQANDQPERSGHIASVVRCGYQYLVNEEDIKIVRCAQVRLYE